MMYSDLDVFGIIAGASNIRTGGNPEYTAETFLEMYPQFNNTEVIPSVVVDAWVKIANASIHKARYHDAWEVAMGLFIAHWLTLFAQGAAQEGDPVQKVINAGLAKGLQTSKSAGDLSVSYDFSSITSDFNGWGTYKLTIYGQQFVTLARIYSIGGMCVW